MSELTARLVKLGRDLGLEGPELRAFVKEERDREEEREAQERQEKKEAQERKDKLELEKLKSSPSCKAYIAKEVEIVANVGVTKESKNNQEQFNRTSRRDKWQQNSNQRSSSCGPNWKQRDHAQPNQRFPRWNDSPHTNFRRQNKGNFRGYSQRRPSRGRGMPSRGNYHSQPYEYASSASILFNKSDKTSPHQLNIVSGKYSFKRHRLYMRRNKTIFAQTQ
ncbi:hypothetical protein PoB_005937700 [Plakobranchus ocellatus]|uniref:Uncharacterized protein n=1 Tax=Plakobranchus ocellatus TaxID=259542 RepID=A0AAV4CMB1_9GAST|nr:hypothetical protein PoB_005937700 [Plakobranchus ocellatus]